MDEKEIQKLLEGFAQKNGEAITAAVKKEIAEAAKGFTTPDQVAAKLAELGVTKEANEKITKALEEQGLAIQKLVAKGSGKDEAFDIQKSVEEQKDALVALSKGANTNDKVSFKLRGANKTLIQRSAVSANTMGIRLPGIGELAVRGTVIRSLFNEVQVSEQELAESNGVVRFIDQATQIRAAAAVAEAGTKPESEATWIERTQPFQVIADTIPTTRQAYRHLGFMASELDRLLRKNLALKFDIDLWSGDGVAPNLRGIFNAQGIVDVNANLAGLPLNGAVNEANLYDLLASIRVLISNSKQSKYNPNVVVMNPIDILRYKLIKALDGHYILPPFVSADGMRIDQMIVVESSAVTANTLLVGDFSYPTLFVSEDVKIEMGYVNDQFIKNQWTIRAEMEALLMVRNVDGDAFAKVTNITNAIAALETP